VVVDGMHEPDVARRVLDLVLRRRTVRHHRVQLSGVATSALRRLVGDASAAELVPRVSSGEQSNSSVRFGDRFILKLFRRAPVGDNPEWEVGRFLTAGSRYPHAPAVAGALELTDAAGRRRTIAVLHELVAHETDAWTHTLGLVDAAFDAMAPLVEAGDVAALPVAGPVAGLVGEVPAPGVAEMLGPVLAEAALLGRRTAELHLALMGPPDDAALVPEPMTAHYQRSLYQSVRTQVQRALALLRRERPGLTGSATQDADRVLAGEPELLATLAELKDRRIAGLRLRRHGDFHLGQVLWTGSDVVIIDFEANLRPSANDGLRPLRDVASMLRSYEYAARAGLERRGAPSEDPAWAAAASCWASWAGAAFLAGYVEAGARLLPEGEGAAEVLLRALLLEKAAYELGYELNQRPDWVGIPLHGMVALLPPSAPTTAP
jgi:trehalose synthase-fused probable maltokinase